MPDKIAGVMRPQGMTLPMMQAPFVTSRTARAATLLAALLTAAAPLAVQAQDMRGTIGGAPQAAAPAPAASAQPAPPPPAPVALAPAQMSESVAAVVNDEIISTYDLAQRMRLLIATSGVQPTQDTLLQFQREALSSLIDERLQLQELRHQEKEQKIDVVATDDEVTEELGGMAQQNNMKADAFLAALRQQGIGKETIMQQIRAQMSWQRWIRGRYGSRLRVGEDQIKATQAQMTATAQKTQYQISEVLIDSGRVGGMDAAVQGAGQLITQIQGGAPFASVARQFSAAATAAAGGDAGWVTQGEMPPEVDAALAQLRPGQLSQAIPVKDGVYIIYLRDKRSGSGQMTVNLKQAAVSLTPTASAGDVEAARVKLESIRVAAKGCDDLEAVAQRAGGVVGGDLGEAEISDLAPQFREAAEKLNVGQISEPIRTNAGLHLVAVCAKRASGPQALDHEQIENRLFGQQLTMVSRRYMRDLRNNATIETK
jgi:peptidyl-prolyl cis-trans isomerase SurA